jgi:hypothetical protein
MKELYICKACWLVASPKIITKGSSLNEVLLWCLFIIPGILYSVWRFITKEKVCPECSSLAVVSIYSVMGQKFFDEIYSNRNTRFGKRLVNDPQYGFSKVDHEILEGQYQVREN